MEKAMLYRLDRTQDLALDIHSAWSFFSDPTNLCRITPDWLGFTITCPAPEPMYAGQILTYTVKPFPGLAWHWVTEITHVREPRFFVDEQRLGPYRFWHHQHIFDPLPGGVRMRDTVHYALPFGPLARLGHKRMVRPRLEAIFDHRYHVLAERFGVAQIAS